MKQILVACFLGVTQLVAAGKSIPKTLTHDPQMSAMGRLARRVALARSPHPEGRAGRSFLVNRTGVNGNEIYKLLVKGTVRVKVTVGAWGGGSVGNYALRVTP